MHDSSKIQMGTTGSNLGESFSKLGSIAAGLVVRQKSDGTITLAKSDGSALGVSLGKDLSNTGFTAIKSSGLKVPVKLASGFTTPAKGGQVAISDTTGEAVAYTGSGDSYVNAYYASGPLTRVDEDGTETANGAAYIDMPGGL
jgi:hypothetical protein